MKLDWAFVWFFLLICLISTIYSFMMEDSCQEHSDEEQNKATKIMSGLTWVVILVMAGFLVSVMMGFPGSGLIDGFKKLAGEQNEIHKKTFEILYAFVILFAFVSSVMGMVSSTECNRYSEGKRYFPAMSGYLTGILTIFLLAGVRLVVR